MNNSPGRSIIRLLALSANSRVVLAAAVAGAVGAWFGVNAYDVRYDPAGMTPQRVEDRLLHRSSVRDYGARGDGAADDTAAIQNAIDTLGPAGGTLYFPSGTYLISSTIAKSSIGGLVMSGDGYSSIINWIGPDYGTMFDIDGNSQGGLMVSDLVIAGGTSATTAMSTSAGGHVQTFRRVQFAYFKIDPTIDSTSRALLEIETEAHNGRIEQCWFIGNGGPDPDPVGIRTNGGVAWVIDNNEFQQIKNWAVYSGSASARLAITNNIIDQLITNVNGKGFFVDFPWAVEISGNYIEATVGDGVHIAATGGYYSASDSTASGRVSDNVFLAVGTSALGFHDIKVGRTRDLIISGNTFFGHGDIAVSVASNAVGSVLERNTMADGYPGSLIDTYWTSATSDLTMSTGGEKFGTWTSAITNATNCSGVSLNTAYFVKQGKLVHVSGYFDLTVAHAGADTSFVFTLPFDFTALSEYSAGAVGVSDFPLTDRSVGYVLDYTSGNSDQAILYIPSEGVATPGQKTASFGFTYIAVGD